MTERQASADGTEARPSSQAPAPAPIRALASEQLLQGAKSVEISHNGAVYRLQATRLGKLILTK
jgi:hemin uptake protein HemP